MSGLSGLVGTADLKFLSVGLVICSWQLKKAKVKKIMIKNSCQLVLLLALVNLF